MEITYQKYLKLIEDFKKRKNKAKYNDVSQQKNRNIDITT